MANKDFPTLWYVATMSRPNFDIEATCEVFTSKGFAVRYVREQGGRFQAQRIDNGLYAYSHNRIQHIETFYVFNEAAGYKHGFVWAMDIIHSRKFSQEEQCAECEGFGEDTDDRGTRLLCYPCMGTGFGHRPELDLEGGASR